MEDLVIEAIYKSLNSENINFLAERIFEFHKNRVNELSTVNLLVQELKEIEITIKNIINAIEQGIFTSSTKERLEELENKKSILQQQIEQEQIKTKLILSKEEIRSHILIALKKDSQSMIDALIKKIILYNDKIEIYLKYTNTKRPDDSDDHQVFLFYSFSKSYEIFKSGGGHSYKITFEITFWA